MAQPMFQPVLNPVTGGTYISPGVEDTSSAKMLAGFGQIGMDMYKGYQTAGMETAVDTSVETYVRRNTAYQEAANALPFMTEEARNQASAALKKASAEDPSSFTPEDVTRFEEAYNNKLATYKQAYEQGRMSSDELVARIQQEAKKVISSTPGWSRELAAHAQHYMDWTGVSSMIRNVQDTEQLTIKQAQEDKKRKEDFVNKVDPTTMGQYLSGAIPSLDQAVQQATRQAAITEQWKQTKEYAESLTARNQINAFVVDNSLKTPEMQSLITSVPKALFRTVWNNIDSKAFVAQAKAINPNITENEANVLGISAMFSEERNFLNRYRGISADPSNKAFLESQIGELNKLEETMLKYASGAIKREGIEMRLAVSQASLDLQTYGLKTELTLANQVASAVSALHAAGLVKMDPKDIAIIIAPLTEKYNTWVLNSKSGPPPLASVDLNTQEGRVAAVGMYSIADPSNSVLGSTPNEVIASNSTSTLRTLEQLKALPARQQSQHAINMLDGYIRQAQEAKKPIKEFFTPEANLAVREYIYNALIGSMEGKNLDYDSVNNKFTLGNQTETDNFNKLLTVFASTDGKNINDIDADAIGEALVRLSKGGPAVAPSAGKADPKNNPGNLKDAQENVRVFASREEGIRANAEQLKLYFKRGSPIDRRPLTTVQDIINSWRPEKDRRKNDISQKDYIDFVAKSLGVAPDQQLQPTNHTLAKLIAAMSIREGHPVAYEDVFDALIGAEETAVAKEQPAATPTPQPAATKQPATETRKARGATKPTVTQTNVWESIKKIATIGQAGTSIMTPYGKINFTGAKDLYPPEKKLSPEERIKNIAALTAAEMKANKYDQDAIQSVTSFLDPLVDAAQEVHPSVGYATAALLVFLGSPRAAEVLTKKITSKGIKFATPPAGREVVSGSNVMPLNESASKAVIAAMRGAKKKEAEALFKDYWTTKWQKDRVSLPKTDLEWRNAIVEANQYVAERLAKKPLKSMDGKK